MFWRYGFHQQSAIDTLLDKGDFRLEELLDEENILQECKGNSKLIDYLTRSEVIETLLCYIVEPPDENVDEAVRYKYPTIASEILSSDVIAICNALISNVAVLEAFWQHLEETTDFNPLQASFFAKVFITLLQRKPVETIQFFQSQAGAVDKILNHIGCSGLMELLIRLISVEEEGESVFQWLAEQQLVGKLIAKLDGNLTTDVHANAVHALVQIINVIQPYNISQVLIGQIKSKEHMSQLVAYMLDTSAPNHNSSLQHGCVVITSLLNRIFGADSIMEPVSEESGVLEVMGEHLPTLYQMLLDCHPTEEVPTSYGKGKPLGIKLLRIIELLSVLLFANSKAINAQFVQLEIVPHLFNLFFQHPWNNFLHSIVMDIVKLILTKPNLEHSKELMDGLFVKSHMLERIVEVSKLAEAESEEPKGVKRGYMGHITVIGNTLVDFEKSHLSDHLKDKFNSTEWKDYASTTLHQINERESKYLGGERPTAGSSLRGSMSETNLFRVVTSGDVGVDQFGNVGDDNFDFDDDSHIPTIASFELDENFNEHNNPFEDNDMMDSVEGIANQNFEWKADFDSGFGSSDNLASSNDSGNGNDNGDSNSGDNNDSSNGSTEAIMEEESTSTPTEGDGGETPTNQE